VGPNITRTPRRARGRETGTKSSVPNVNRVGGEKRSTREVIRESKLPQNRAERQAQKKARKKGGVKSSMKLRKRILTRKQKIDKSRTGGVHGKKRHTGAPLQNQKMHTWTLTNLNQQGGKKKRTTVRNRRRGGLEVCQTRRDRRSNQGRPHEEGGGNWLIQRTFGSEGNSQ